MLYIQCMLSEVQFEVLLMRSLLNLVLANSRLMNQTARHQLPTTFTSTSGAVTAGGDINQLDKILGPVLVKYLGT